MFRLFRYIFALFGTLVIVSWIVLAFTLLQGQKVEEGTVLILTLDGPLSEQRSESVAQMIEGEEQATLLDIIMGLRRAASDPKVVGLVLEIGSPQVGIAQLQELETAMAVFRKSKKWSYAFVETAGEFSRGDGAYALAAMADKVILTPVGEINLVGLRAQVPFIEQLMKRLHIDVHVERRHGYKNAGDMFVREGFSKPQAEATKALLDDLQEVIIKHLAARRGVDEAQVNDWFTSSPHTAKNALEQGLIDHVGYRDTLIGMLPKGDDTTLLEVTDYTARATATVAEGAKKIAVIIAAGEINRGGSTGGGSSSIGSDTFSQAFRDARIKKVDGVLLRIDSPGGSYIASDLIRREMELTQQAGIPVVVSMGNVAASGGYYIAMGADHVVAEAGTITGSIGVIAIHFALGRALQHWFGVTFDSYATVADNGTLSDGVNPLTVLQKLKLKDNLDRIYHDFVARAANARKMSYEALHAVAQGRVWSGKQALKNGLVDELGGMQLALQRLKERLNLTPTEEVELLVLPHPKSGMEQLVELLGGQVRMITQLKGGLHTLINATRSQVAVVYHGDISL